MAAFLLCALAGASYIQRPTRAHAWDAPVGSPHRSAVVKHSVRMELALASHTAARRVQALTDDEISHRFHEPRTEPRLARAAGGGGGRVSAMSASHLRQHCRICEVAKDAEVTKYKAAIAAHKTAEAEEAQMGSINAAFEDASAAFSAAFDEWHGNKTALVQEHGLARNLVENQKYMDPFTEVEREIDSFVPLLEKLKAARVGAVAAKEGKDKAVEVKKAADAAYTGLVGAAAAADEAASQAEADALKACAWMVEHKIVPPQGVEFGSGDDDEPEPEPEPAPEPEPEPEPAAAPLPPAAASPADEAAAPSPPPPLKFDDLFSPSPSPPPAEWASLPFAPWPMPPPAPAPSTKDCFVPKSQGKYCDSLANDASFLSLSSTTVPFLVNGRGYHREDCEKACADDARCGAYTHYADEAWCQTVTNCERELTARVSTAAATYSKKPCPVDGEDVRRTRSHTHRAHGPIPVRSVRTACTTEIAALRVRFRSAARRLRRRRRRRPRSRPLTSAGRRR